MQGFIEIAKTDFMATFEDSWIFPVLIFCIFWILWKEQDRTKKWLAGILPLILLVLYWCPITGILLMKILGENVYWRILWLVPVSVTIPVAFCLLLKSMKGGARFAVFLILSAVIVLGGKKVLLSHTDSGSYLHIHSGALWGKGSGAGAENKRTGTADVQGLRADCQQAGTAHGCWYGGAHGLGDDRSGLSGQTGAGGKAPALCL